MMDLDEFRKEMEKVSTKVQIGDACCREQPKLLEPARSPLPERLARGVILVTDLDGKAKYMRIMPDGHLGAIED